MIIKRDFYINGAWVAPAKARDQFMVPRVIDIE